MTDATPASRYEALVALLAAHPEAFVGAVDATARYVDIPDGVPVGAHRRLTGRWALDHVEAGDRGALANAWTDRHGSAVTEARVRLVTGGSATFHLFALSELLGADIVVAIADEGADLGAAVAARPVIMRSRFCRMLRDDGGRTIEIDDAAPTVLGLPAEELLSGRPPMERIHPDDRANVIESWMATLANETDGHRCRFRLRRGDGAWAWFEMTSFNRLDDPVRPHVVSELLDISEEMSAHEEVAAREQLLHRLAEALPLGVLQLDHERRILYKNDYLSEMLGVAHATTMDEQFVDVSSEDRPLLDKAFSVAIDGGADDDVVVRVTGKGPVSDRLVRVITKSLHAPGGEVSGVIACISDVTEATLMGRELERRATYDALTGCLNRAAILARLEGALAPGGVGGAAVIFIDLDRFKEVNDRAGHAVGDEVLKATARVLETVTRSTDVVGRIGGDEFLVVCQDVRDEATAVALAERIAAGMRTTRVEGAGVELAASFGVAWSEKGVVDADDLVQRSDEAMYASKREGACRPHVAPR
jgi:diguanylate cyclase (GGDEF)-like protein/PAS domain S-box-containing protein